MEEMEMRCLTKTSLLSLALFSGGAIAAHAQSVANLPPAGAAAGTPSPVYSAPPVAGPNPGSNVGIASAPAYQKPADWESNRAYHPYSTSGAGPNPGSNVSANNEPYTPPPGGDSAAGHPYSQGGSGPAPGANINIPSGH
jgi:hypothetical protein